MNPATAMPILAEGLADERDESPDEILRERERIRDSYLTIRQEELDRLERIIEAHDAD